MSSDARRVQPAPGTVRDSPLAQAVMVLESGLVEDRALIGQAQMRGVAPDWSMAIVVADFPSRYRHLYDSRFANRLLRAGFALTHAWANGNTAPDCPAQFLLARWLLDRAIFIADTDLDGVHTSPRRWAGELGLIDENRPGIDLIHLSPDRWLAGWDLESVRLNPSEWFEPTAPSARYVAAHSRSGHVDRTPPTEA